MTELKWLLAHEFPIDLAIVHFDKIKGTFDTKMISEMELVDNYNVISSTVMKCLHFLLILKRNKILM